VNGACRYARRIKSWVWGEGILIGLIFLHFLFFWGGRAAYRVCWQLAEMQALSDSAETLNNAVNDWVGISLSWNLLGAVQSRQMEAQRYLILGS
jgi:hypothetical protein